MNTIDGWVAGAAAHLAPVLRATFAFAFLQPHHQANTALLVLSVMEGLSRRVIWFLAVGMVLYAFWVRRPNRSRLERFSYSIPIHEPSDRFSLSSGLKYLLPKSVYSHYSFRIDMMWLPFMLTLSLLRLAGLTVGAGAVQIWLLHQFGRSPISLPDGEFVVVLQVAIILVAQDFGHYIWHFQAHKIPFFWEFHKGHHALEVLHPFGSRVHPFDTFLRDTYMGVGGGLIAGTLIYLLGMSFSTTAAIYVVGWYGVTGVLSMFEHSHVRLSYGKTLNRLFYAPYMHHFHHGAGPEHMNVNLGMTGGLILWDHLFGTLHWPRPGEKVVWGASLEELGTNNPHQTLWAFFAGPFVAAFRVLRRYIPELGHRVFPGEGA